MSIWSVGKDIFGNMAKAAGKATWHGMKKAGSIGMTGMDYVGKGMEAAAVGTAKGTVKAADAVGKGAFKVGKSYVKHANSNNPLENPVGFAAHAGYKAASKMGYRKLDKSVYDEATGKLHQEEGGLRFTKLGLGVLFGTGAVGGLGAAVDQASDDRVGPIDPQKATATPVVESRDYSRHLTPEDTGATGDLVFALHANRHG